MKAIPPTTNSVSTVVELLRQRALDAPEHLAYTFLTDGEAVVESNLTYRELDQQARAIGAKLQSLGATGERVLLLYPPGLEFISAFLGCLYAGAVAVPAHPLRHNRTIQRVDKIVADVQAKIALTTTPLIHRLKSQWEQLIDPPPVSFVATDDVPCNFAAQWRAPAVNGNALAFLQYTSGSTSQPRGVMVSHSNILHNQQLLQQAFRTTEQDVFVGWLPFHHDMGLIGNVLHTLYAGARCILMSPISFLQRPFRWLQAISHYRATVSGGPNFAYDFCVRKIKEEHKAALDLSCWRAAFNGSEPVRAKTLKDFAARFASCGFRREAFSPCYGLAESTLIVSIKKGVEPVVRAYQKRALGENRVVEVSTDDESARQLVGCGQIVGDQKLIIVDPESLTECPPDRIGEIWLNSPSAAQGYWNQPEKTLQTFHAYLADSKRGPYLRTGDLGFLDAGELFITNRLKDLIIIHGQNYYPDDIELTVEQSHHALLPGGGAAFTIESAGLERLIILHEVKRDSGLDMEEIKGAIRQAVAECHGVQVYDVRLLKSGTIPKTTSGKIQRHACRDGFVAGTLSFVSQQFTERVLS